MHFIDRSKEDFCTHFYLNTIDQEIDQEIRACNGCTVEICFFTAKFYSDSIEQRGKTVESIEIRE